MRILIISGGLPPRRSGGAPAYFNDLRHELSKRGNEVFYLDTIVQDRADTTPRIREASPGSDNFHFINTGATVPFLSPSPSPLADIFASPAVTKVFEAFLAKVNPDVIHFHELLGFPLSLLKSSRRMQVPTVFTSQDYYPLCPVIQLYRENGECCQRRAQDLVCDQCLSHLGWGRFTFQKQRIIELLNTPKRRVLTKPSLYANTIHQKLVEILGTDRAKYQRRRRLVIEHLAELDLMISISKRHHEIIKNLTESSVPLRQVYLSRKSYQFSSTAALRRSRDQGGAKFMAMNVHSIAKGSELLFSEFHMLRARIPNCELHMYGGDEQPTANGVYFHGSYAPDELSEIASLYDAGIIPSIWEETYGYVGPELLSRGLPVVASNRGAMREYVHHEENGLIFDSAVKGSLADALERIVTDRSLHQRLMEGALIPSEATPRFEDHVDTMETIYREVVAERMRLKH